MLDEIAPTAVADYVWATCLKDRHAEESYWQLPNADHYLQNDNPLVLSLLIRQSLSEKVDLSAIPSEQAPIEAGVNPGY